MVIKPGTIVRGMVGFQAFIAGQRKSMVFGKGEMEWEFKGDDADDNGALGLQGLALGSAVLLSIFSF